MTKRILIVDDEPKVINILTQFFQMQHGHAYEITSAGNVRDALAILLREGFGFDLILLEVDMSWMGEPVRPPPPRSLPGSHGLDLLKEIRKRGMNVPVIMMCGIPTQDEMDEAQNAGAFAWLHKPLELREMESLVAEDNGT